MADIFFHDDPNDMIETILFKARDKIRSTTHVVINSMADNHRLRRLDRRMAALLDTLGSITRQLAATPPPLPEMYSTNVDDIMRDLETFGGMREVA